jgi:myo-inositol-1(or 4)-monophosphatase
VLFQDPEAFLAEIEQIASLGAEQLMAHWRALQPDQVNEKARNDLVTAADLASEEAILRAIRSRFPEHSILSEEAGRSAPTDGGPTWIIDPLDGTTNFVHGIPQFAISIAVAVEGRIDFGVILDPCKNDLFSAARGHGARWNGVTCRVSERAGLSGALVATGFPFKAHRLLDPYLAIFRDVFLRCKAVRRPGAAALDLAYTACGLFDGFFEFQLSVWDVAAGSVLVEVCGTAGVHRELLEVVDSHREEWQNHLG